NLPPICGDAPQPARFSHPRRRARSRPDAAAPAGDGNEDEEVIVCGSGRTLGKYRTVPSPNGPTVNSQGRKPLESMAERETSPNGAKDIFSGEGSFAPLGLDSCSFTATRGLPTLFKLAVSP